MMPLLLEGPFPPQSTAGWQTGHRVSPEMQTHLHSRRASNERKWSLLTEGQPQWTITNVRAQEVKRSCASGRKMAGLATDGASTFKRGASPEGITFLVLQSRRPITGVLKWEFPESALGSAPKGTQGNRGARGGARGGAPEGAQGNWGCSRECSRG